MPTVLVYLDGDPQRGAILEAVTLARQVGDVVALAAQPPDGDALQTLGRYGVTRVLHLDAGAADLRVPAVVGQAVAAAAEETGATAVLLTSSFVTKEIAAHTAHHLRAGLLVDMADLHLHEGRLAGAKRAFGGTWDTACAVTTARGVATVSPNAVVPEPAERSGPAEAGIVTVTATAPAGLELVSRQTHESTDAAGPARPSLAEAAIVVCGGRGTFGDFDPVNELADELGAAVGTTRDCVDEGWLGHDAQVGQTGVTVAPRLYIGAGISGAPHHIGGMSAAQTIVAVNIDAEAPLVEMADFAVVGDLASVLSDAAAAIREHRAS